ncbi:MAG TPA: GGDEF domain-containing protein [Casimicrobiaceae bacterium]|nr:GGDEF domain-containing protein [Casimicrobiaceae bacterium]
MMPGFSTERRIAAAFAAGVVALAFVASLVVWSANAYVTDELGIDDALRDAHVQSKLSSTNGEPTRSDDRAAPTKRVDDWLFDIRARHAVAKRRFEVLEARGAMFAALTVMLIGAAIAMLQWQRRDRTRLAARLDAERNHDPLTGLPNRRFFSEWLSFAIANARRHHAHVGVLFIDVGGCVAVAELHGGQAAEALLVEVARRFRATARDGEVFARLGASEFALATANADHTRELSVIAQRLRDALNDPAQAPLADTPIGMSIGVALFPEDAGDSAGVLAAANAAMFAARRAGRNHVAFNALAA